MLNMIKLLIIRLEFMYIIRKHSLNIWSEEHCIKSFVVKAVVLVNDAEVNDGNAKIEWRGIV